MSIDKRILHRILMESLDKYWPRPSGDGRRWCDRLDRELIDYLIEVILFRNPTEGCYVLGRASDWDGLPASKSLFNTPENVGLAIGDITSQLFSNIFMDHFDQFIKRQLHCRHYGRYVDDFYVIHPDRQYLEALVVRLKEFLEAELHLTIHPKKIVLQPYNYGVAFLGAYVKPFRRYATKSSVKRFHVRMSQLEAECRHGAVAYNRLVEIRAVLNSYCGHFVHFKAFRMLKAQFSDSPLRKYFDFSGNFRKAVIKQHFLPQWKMPFEEDEGG